MAIPYEKEFQHIKLLEAMFESPGWKIVVADAVESIKQLKEQALYASDYPEVSFYRGKAEALATIVNLQESILIAKENLELAVAEGTE